MCCVLRVLHGEPVGRGPLCSAASTALRPNTTTLILAVSRLRARLPCNRKPHSPGSQGGPFRRALLHSLNTVGLCHLSNFRLPSAHTSHLTAYSARLLPCLFWSPDFHSCAPVFSRIIVVMVPGGRIPIVLGPALPGSSMANTTATCCRSVSQLVPKPLYQYHSSPRKPSALCVIGGFSDL
ncbi:hypothetical protein IQ06DRAFT_11968 [Phaeosphaeriaceae sp. SRC1lsM3a]|nr:hypothetical protein IQ06DRAFT_11968 [Stagonospora sp. SRC1lsM3a]